MWEEYKIYEKIRAACYNHKTSLQVPREKLIEGPFWIHFDIIVNFVKKTYLSSNCNNYVLWWSKDILKKNKSFFCAGSISGIAWNACMKIPLYLDNEMPEYLSDKEVPEYHHIWAALRCMNNILCIQATHVHPVARSEIFRNTRWPNILIFVYRGDRIYNFCLHDCVL